MHSWLVALLSYSRSGGCPPKRSHSNFPMSPPATSWQLGDAGCNNEEQQRPSVSAFSFGHSAQACFPEPRGVSETERSERVCFTLISDIAGQDVNCTSRLQFVRPASSVLSWLVFRQRGGQVYTPPLLYMQKRATTFGGKHTYSSCLVYYGSPLRKCAAGNAEYFSFWLSPPCFQKHMGAKFCHGFMTTCAGKTTIIKLKLHWAISRHIKGT